jgi:single-stranded-DNA-specific exonuclease
LKPRNRTDGLPPPTPSEAAFEAFAASYGTGAATGGTDGAATAVTPSVVEGPPQDAVSESAAFLAELYAKSAAFLDRDQYASIGDSFGFNTKIVGVTFEGRQDLLGGMEPGQALELVRQPDNAFDANAIAVHFGRLQLGFLKKAIAARIAPNIDAGERYRAEVKHITGGGTRSVGVNIWVTREKHQPQRTNGGARARGADVQAALLGDRPLRDAQRDVLERVASGRNTLAVLGTGRGKSLCFQLPAAVNALEHGKKTVVLYPLRALANDQYEALIRRLEPLGLRIFRANGAIDAGERAELMDALESGAWDIVCTTPEFMHFHADRFVNDVSRPSLLVVDEAHHVIESTHRPAYGRVGELVRKLGNPQVLALTATAGDEVFAGIRAALGIDAWVIDPTIRENLHVVEARGVTNKLAYIQKNIDAEGKAIIYCNSRSEATKVAEKLRGQFKDAVAFYHAGVGTAERAQVERFFREGAIRVIVATSAFGEGVDLPDVRDVFLYHLNFDLTEFNQQSGRAGRDGEPAQIHLLFGERDRNINDFILERDAPTLHTLRGIYRGMKAIAGDGMIRMTYADIASALDQGDKVADRTIGAAVRIFNDAGLVELGEDDDGRYVRFLEVTGKVDLTQNERFAEGEAERESFKAFCELVLKAQPDVLQTVINRPIYPSNVPHLR